MFKRASFIIRDYFGFSRSETRGLFLLLLVISLALVCMMYFEKTTYETYQNQQADHLILDSLIEHLSAQKPQEAKKFVAAERALFQFNPNLTSLEDLQRLGIEKRLSQRIVNYRNKGGKFVKSEDLMKIYDFPQALYEELQPYIELPKATAIKRLAEENKQPVGLHKVEESLNIGVEEKRINYDINLADSVQLSGLRGIGSVLSSRIVKYRDKLGGFHDLGQLKEIYHINEDALKSLEEFSYVNDDFVPKKIKINEVDFKSLLKHPYIDYDLCKSIMNHRRIYGNFSSPEELKEVYQIKEELLVKLLPYIVI